MSDPIHLDHNATTPILPEVLDRMLPYLREHFGNPSSGHAYGRRAHEAVAGARAQVAALVGAEEDEIVFTSGATEANNLAIFGTALSHRMRLSRGIAHGRPGRVVSTAIEHPAVAEPCSRLKSEGWELTRVSVDEDGRARVDELLRQIPGATLVSVMHSNNETGVLQPVAEAARAARAAGALMHTDAAQSVGKVPIDVRSLDVSLLSIAGHKLYAPKGVGALYVRRGVRLVPPVLGAGHERGLRPGTENVASIVGLGAACEIARRDLVEVSARLSSLRDALESELRAAVPGLVRNGHASERLPNTSNVRFPRVSGAALLRACPALAASTGSACHDGVEQASAVLVEMGISASDALGSIRLTLGRGSTREELQRAAALLSQAWADETAR